MSKSNTATEPSMEEILASIRRIIADEDQPKANAARVAPAEPTDEPSAAPVPKPVPAPVKAVPPSGAGKPPAAPDLDEDVLDLAMAATEKQVAAAQRPALVNPMPDVEFADLEPPAPPAVERAPAIEPPPLRSEAAGARRTGRTPDEALLSRETGAQVAHAFGSLAQLALAREPRTLEDLTKELLRPMLREWLDDNLPTLVERLVREEIERVARGR